MKLLVVEDENKTADYVRQGLMEAGFVVDLARNGLDGHHLAMSETYDLVVLDVMLPDVDGWRIVRALRDAGKQVPVLFLTAWQCRRPCQGLELGGRLPRQAIRVLGIAGAGADAAATRKRSEPA
jgi:two-component system copper resistance phosphate regulon response regulator CusR